jgi:hypothetical protein
MNMNMNDIHLQADSESTLAKALLMFRMSDENGNDSWITGSLYHTLDLNVQVVKEETTFDEGGKVLELAILVEGFSANLRLVEEHPEYKDILKAVRPYIVNPSTPQRVFA